MGTGGQFSGSVAKRTTFGCQTRAARSKQSRSTSASARAVRVDRIERRFNGVLLFDWSLRACVFRCVCVSVCLCALSRYDPRIVPIGFGRSLRDTALCFPAPPPEEAAAEATVDGDPMPTGDAVPPSPHVRASPTPPDSAASSRPESPSGHTSPAPSPLPLWDGKHPGVRDVCSSGALTWWQGTGAVTAHRHYIRTHTKGRRAAVPFADPQPAMSGVDDGTSVLDFKWHVKVRRCLVILTT